MCVLRPRFAARRSCAPWIKRAQPGFRLWKEPPASQKELRHRKELHFHENPAAKGAGLAEAGACARFGWAPWVVWGYGHRGNLRHFFFIPRFANPLLDQLVSAHVRSLMPSHLIDVVSTDKHTVKPWFTGHADVSPAVADFEPQGYRLIGGRVDYLDHQRSAVVVYQHGAHVINVFSWAGNERALPNDVTRNGYHLAFWKAGDLEYCAVSDTGWDELLWAWSAWCRTSASATLETAPQTKIRE